MLAILHLHSLLIFVGDIFKSRRRLEAENLFLRHQLNIALRRAPHRLRLRGSDRALFVLMTRLWPSLLDLSQVVKPETILRWHRSGFKAFWRWKSRNRVGRPKVDRELRDLIRRMSRENPLWGAPRIHGELLMLGFEVAQATVSKYMARGRNPPSQSWRTFLRNHAEAISAIDMCVVPTLTFERLFAFLVLGHGRRQLLWFEVTRHPTAEWLARQITEAFPWASAPAYLVRDNDRAYGQVFTSRVRAMGVRDRPISPGSPWQNGYAERLIGTVRRECLDRTLIFGEAHLRRILLLYACYYNETRTHLSLRKDAPLGRAVQRHGAIIAMPVLAGLHHRYARIRFSERTGPALSDPRSGWDLRCRCHPPSAGHGYSRQADFAWVAVAELLCREADRLDPPRVRRPRDRVGRATLAARPALLCALL
jgi:transposase InsO family protein